MAFKVAKAERDLLEMEVTAASEILRTFPHNAMGLVSDVVKLTPEYRAANARYKRAFVTLRDFQLGFREDVRERTPRRACQASLLTL